MLAVAMIAISGQVAAQSYPNKPLRLIVPFPPGGPTDIVGRVVAQSLTQRLGQNVVVDNRPGASTSIGTEAVVRSAPDGYTLLLGSSTMAINPVVMPNLPYDALRDLAPIALASRMPGVLAVHPAVPANNLREFIALAKAQPGKLNYGTGGRGTADHLIGVLFSSMAGIQLTDVPYKGSAALLTDLVGGQLDATFSTLGTALPYVRSGKLRPIGVTLGHRSPSAPDIPTIAEGGLPEFQVSSWFGVFAPAQTPADILDKLNAEIAAGQRTAEVKERFAAVGADVEQMSREQFARLVRDDTARWARVVKENNLKL
ncbi:MAG: tripartite tricarboxylate transporter substrate binding protein [Candidatus Parcubacteria bacterium]|nr:tripartite tricarboxylate transporter substrate binding protein [Burkholderiales bacterium]